MMYVETKKDTPVNMRNELTYALSLLLAIAVTIPILSVLAPRFGAPTWGANPSWYAASALAGISLCYLGRVMKYLVQKWRS